MFICKPSPLPKALLTVKEIQCVKELTVQTQEVVLFCFSFYPLSQCFFLPHASTDFDIPLECKMRQYFKHFDCSFVGV